MNSMEQHILACEHSAVKQETAPTAVKTETEEESAASSVPRGASAAGNEESSGEQHVERQQSENREATASVSAKEEDNEEELNVEELTAGGDDLVQPNNDVTGGDGNVARTGCNCNYNSASEVVGTKNKTSSIERRYARNARAQTRSKKRAKGPHSTLHETPEVTGTAQPRVVEGQRGGQRPMLTKGHLKVHVRELRPRRQRTILCLSMKKMDHLLMMATLIMMTKMANRALQQSVATRSFGNQIIR
jgi:hypothetical protein